jgi:ABC-type branched-subunit amino acid transport system ATPase component
VSADIKDAVLDATYQSESDNDMLLAAEALMKVTRTMLNDEIERGLLLKVVRP